VKETIRGDIVVSDDDEKRSGVRETRGIQDEDIKSNKQVFFKLAE